MSDIVREANNQLQIVFNQFVEEQIGSNKIKLMPPAEKIPIIEKFNYNSKADIFEILFKYKQGIHPKEIRKGYVSFLEYEKQLVAIHIHSFSKLDIKSIRMDAITTIKDEIKSLALALKKKESIQNNIIEKRKLEFTEKMVANEFEKMKVNEL